MKFFIVVAFVAVIAAVQAVGLTEEEKYKAKQYITECKTQFKITDEEFTQLRSGYYQNASEDVKCFANCFLEKVGIFKDGAIQEAVILGKFGPTIGEEQAKKVIELCRAESGANKCETALKLYACFIKNKAILE